MSHPPRSNSFIERRAYAHRKDPSRTTVSGAQGAVPAVSLSVGPASPVLGTQPRLGGAGSSGVAPTSSAAAAGAGAASGAAPARPTLHAISTSPTASYAAASHVDRYHTLSAKPLTGTPVFPQTSQMLDRLLSQSFYGGSTTTPFEDDDRDGIDRILNQPPSSATLARLTSIRTHANTLANTHLAGAGYAASGGAMMPALGPFSPASPDGLQPSDAMGATRPMVGVSRQSRAQLSESVSVSRAAAVSVLSPAPHLTQLHHRRPSRLPVWTQPDLGLSPDRDGETGDKKAAGPDKSKRPGGFVNNAKLVVWSVLMDTTKDSRNFVVGLLCVFLCVTFLALIQNILDRASTLVINAAENKVGEYDLILTTALSHESQSPFLNFTAINSSIQAVPEVQGASPRWILPARVVPAAADYRDLDATYTSPPPENIYLAVINSDWEKHIGLGTRWPYRALGRNEISISASVLRAFKIPPQTGRQVNVTIELASFLSSYTALSLETAAGNASANPLASAFPPGGTLVPTVFFTTAVTLGVLEADALTTFNQTTDQRFYNVTAEGAWQYVLDHALSYTMSFTVVDAITESYAKYPISFGNVAVIEFTYAQQLVRQTMGSLTVQVLGAALWNGTPPSWFANAATFPMAEYAFMVNLLARGREAIYAKASSVRSREIIELSNNVAKSMDLATSIAFNAALLEVVEATSTLQLYLNETFFLIVFALVILGIILVYSLLLANVEEKAFQYGMWRMLGMTHTMLIEVIVVQSLWFSLPAIGLGLMFAFMAFIPVDYTFLIYTGGNLNTALGESALLLSILVGLFIPLLGMILPIRRALTATLHDALDPSRKVSLVDPVHEQRLRDLGISPMGIAASILAIVIGILTYYFVPYAFINNQYNMFYRILTIMLLLMLAGKVMVGQFVQPYLEWALVRGSLPLTKDRFLTSVVLKNLSAHFERNRKSSLMLMICVAYLIFSYCMFSLQLDTLSDSVRATYGSDFNVGGLGFGSPLDEATLNTFLAKYAANSTDPIDQSGTVGRVVDAWSYQTYALDGYAPIQELSVQRLGHGDSIWADPIGLDAAFTSATYRPFLMRDKTTPAHFVGEVLEAPAWGSAKAFGFAPGARVAEHISTYQTHRDQFNYSRPLADAYANPIPVVVSEGMANTLLAQLGDVVLLTVTYLRDGATLYLSWFLQVEGMLAKCPGITSMTATGARSAVLMSMTNYQMVLDTVEAASRVPVARQNQVTPDVAYPGITKGTLYIKLVEGVTALQRTTFFELLTNAINNADVTITDVQANIDQDQVTTQYIQSLFYIVAVIGMIFSFFVLWISFAANIRENSWEFGILRALGLTKHQIIRVYVYESLAVVLSAVIWGTLIGMTTSAIMVLQFSALTSYRFGVTIPVPIYILVVVLSVIIAIVASYLPSSRFAEAKIANVIRGSA
ncbi:hypothetical protein CXG81DRAFT_25710 [Caulochytrium protostelioides]|uniref:ABC3 transporter permease C-terminal domain-containing protein n=1 Tax=Caulochytrium protostelioides TaxID=1555241 RepID=A0A4P9X8I6_9FUNG|nr:hypothetical protein CXG81DRAFT_25710 [Caulochytrium protostelioides]|eukprot:RKP01614.1 hypothetical protein CXG81DRAFT_25710 [Caulochytrium protostelioides]